MSKIIYIADDELHIRELIQSFLINEGYLTEVFSDGLSLMKAFETSEPDLIILDIMMPGMDGLSICASIRKRSAVPIIIVSAKDGPLDRVAGITLGSDDYLVKPFLPLELVARVKALFRRIELIHGALPDEKIMVYGDITLNCKTRDVALNEEHFAVTPTEFSFLNFMLEHCDSAVSREDLLKAIWKFDTGGIDTRAADDLVKRLRKKLKDSNSTVGIDTVWGYGFRLSLKKG